MPDLPLPIQVIYAGLAGTLLALFVATAQNKWSCKVFFLLALRLAIGWHFLFEGLHKIHSHEVGVTDTSKPFSSEPYFKVAPGPVGAYMRKQFDDPAATIADIVKPAKEISSYAFAKLSIEDQAAACPQSVADALNAMTSKTEEAIQAAAKRDLEEANSTEAKELALPDKTDADKEKIKAKAETTRQDAQKRANTFKDIAPNMITAAKAAYARWVYGVDGRETKVKILSTNVNLTAPQRLDHLDRLRKDIVEEDQRRQMGLGSGYGIENKKESELRMDLVTAESDLARDAKAFVSELKTDLNGGKSVEEPAEPKRGQLMDRVTMWFITAVGALLMFGLFTRLACLLGAGFLVMTYLAHPAFPWFPQPPNTEGNPLFINKNIIECLALLSLMCMPTGRWLGLDALFGYFCCGGKSEANGAA